ncbi:protein of unknown function DUF632 [Dillenia turbinata]|uniref:DUF632 domain-containing protein n=1 Tax=Dillenia turbinata TaxID=194707 RepID=A0AAN8USJ3_9MAGN
MGCGASKLKEEEEAVAICKERKRQLKLAVERRNSLAEAHCRYFQALYAVSASIKLFVARHSSPSSPFVITFSQKENDVSNPMLLQQSPSQLTHETIACGSCISSSISSDSSEEEQEAENEERREREEEVVVHDHGYFYMGVPPPPMPSPHRDFGWDFFNPFDSVRPEMMGYNQVSEEDLGVVREEEGISELEEEKFNEEVMVGENVNGKHEKESGNEVLRVADEVSNLGKGGQDQEESRVIDTPVRGRELLEALKDIEDHFVKAYDSGKDVSRMLEASRFYLHSGLEEIRENSAKFLESTTWHRSISSKSSSWKSLTASSSSISSSSTWMEYKDDLFEENGSMDSGSHSLTLGRLYAWEKKLYEEVKVGDSMRKLYQRKCSQLRNQNVKGDDSSSADKTRAAVKDLYTRILVAIRTAESISKRIQQLRDEELQPQILELLQGLASTWKIMMECHETQNKIMLEVKSFTYPANGKFCNESHRHATLQLQAELQNWRSCFTRYIAAQRAYIVALHQWLSKYLVPEVEFYSKGKFSAPLSRSSGPPLLLICNNWLASMDKLPVKGVDYAWKCLGKYTKALLAHQREGQQQKRKVESLAKEVDRKILSFQKSENRILELKYSEERSDADERQSFEYLTDRKDLLESLRRELDLEKARHQSHMEETQRITLNGLQTGFSMVFETLAEFSKASFKMYNDLLNCESSKKNRNNPCIESTRDHEDGS